MRQSPIYLAVGFLLAIAGLPLTGCTLIGYAVGNSIDHGNLVPGTTVSSLAEMREGDLCRIVKIDSSVVIGTYVDILPPTHAEVQEPYDQWRAADSSRRSMPRYRDSVAITLDTPVPRYLHGRLDRISTDSLWVVGYGGPRPPIRGISLREIQTLTSATGGQIEGQDLRNKVAVMVLLPPASPPPSTLILKVDFSYEYALRIDSIATVQLYVPASSTGRTWGTYVGLFVDTAVFVVAAVAAIGNLEFGP